LTAETHHCSNCHVFDPDFDDDGRCAECGSTLQPVIPIEETYA